MDKVVCHSSFCPSPALQTSLAGQIELLGAGNKEKVMRIALTTLQCLLNVGDPELEAAMVECGLPRIVRIRSAQSFADEDIPELLEKLEEALSTKVTAMSNFDKYRAEVLGGHLEWGPMHTSPQFWQVRCVCVVYNVTTGGTRLVKTMPSFREGGPSGECVVSHETVHRSRHEFLVGAQ
jgi:hypothetical protein